MLNNLIKTVRRFYPLHLFHRNVSRGNFLLTTKEDVYVQRVKNRLSKNTCEYEHCMDPGCKVAIITGGETGIGLATAHELLAAGARVVMLAGMSEGEKVVSQLIASHGQGRSCHVNIDVNSPRDFEDLFYRVNMVFGGIDIVFNNAGILQDHVWEYEVDTNLKSVIRSTILGMDYMGKDGKGGRKSGGVIINHSDVMALDGFPYVPAYVATKAGIIGATLSFGSNYHYVNSGVRVVGLLSGPTDTAMLHNCSEKQLNPEWGRRTLAALTAAPPQSPVSVARAVVHMVKYAPPGSLWTVENGELFTTKIPHRKMFSTKITQL